MAILALPTNVRMFVMLLKKVVLHDVRDCDAELKSDFTVIVHVAVESWGRTSLDAVSKPMSTRKVPMRSRPTGFQTATPSLLTSNVFHSLQALCFFKGGLCTGTGPTQFWGPCGSAPVIWTRAGGRGGRRRPRV